MDSDSITQFVAEAVRFETWARNSELKGEPAAREALIRIGCLYLAALQLPPAWTDELAIHPEVERLTADENCRVTAYKSIPIDMYGEVFDPLVLPPEVPVIGSIADDVIDIYREIVTGLRAYQSGNRAGALWEWGIGFHSHWGEHATGAIRAIHAWLASNAMKIP